MQLTGAEIIIECLKEQKVDTVFGYPGGAHSFFLQLTAFYSHLCCKTMKRTRKQ